MLESLAYIGFTSPRAQEWTKFGPEVLGLEVAPERGSDGAVRLRMDDAVHRIAIHPGETNDLAYMGWSVGSLPDLDAMADRLTAAGVEVTREGDELARERRVGALISFSDPFGVRNEIAWGLTHRPGTFRPGRPMSGFVTGEGGLGHIVLVTPDFGVSEPFYCDLLGFKVTDEIHDAGPLVHFYNINERHHSLAMAQIPGIAGVHHLMLETRDLDDVGTGLAAAIAAGAEVTLTLGRHTNDRMTSIYVRTPAAFEIEYGWGGITVEEAMQRPRRFDRISIWGHLTPTGENVPPPPQILHPVGEAVATPGVDA